MSKPDQPSKRRRTTERTPRQSALNLLIRREHSRKELTRKLQARGIEVAIAQAVVDRLADEGWQDNMRFAEALIRSRAGNGYGPLYLRAKLYAHGLDSTAANAALARYEGDWTENAQNLIKRRFGELDPADLAQRLKVANFLARRGFDASSIDATTRLNLED